MEGKKEEERGKEDRVGVEGKKEERRGKEDRVGEGVLNESQETKKRLGNL